MKENMCFLGFRCGEKSEKKSGYQNNGRFSISLFRDRAATHLGSVAAAASTGGTRLYEHY